MKKLPALLVIPLLALTSAAVRAGVPPPAARAADIDSGLTYMRPAPDGLIGIGSNGGSTILDLRYFPADAKTAHTWLSTIGHFVTPRHPCLLLVSPETSPSFLKGLGTDIPDVITIGRDSPAFHPDITVDTSAESDHAAWLALGKLGITEKPSGILNFYNIPGIEKLITSTVDKTRYDESVLAKEHAAELNGDDPAPPDDSADAADTSAPTGKDAKPAAKPKPLVDAVLQRAVQIDRGLIALRKL